MFGALALPADSKVAGARIIDAMLSRIPLSRIGTAEASKAACAAIRHARAQLDTMRCRGPGDFATHEMACALADFALGDHAGLYVRLTSARAMGDDAFMSAGTLMVVLNTGWLMPARDLAADALDRYPDDACVLRQVANVYLCGLEFRPAIEVLSTLFDLAERSGATDEMKWRLASELMQLGALVERVDEAMLDERALVVQVQLAIDVACEAGHAIIGLEWRAAGSGGAAIEMGIDASARRCERLAARLAEVLDAYVDRRARQIVTIVYRSYRNDAVR
ncbi:hypothetical protein [Pararobbsia silviterrae]|uniref:Uncharacterized protein n=1 Tax=Pararobbsia silviterrae TaxID=1792498 RepID=A0A494Y0Z8_9BURK|nr:hypothetical protein [Pararobbsia silviterrae]RKP55909.1 hypothetical protein D7S86_11955 [Pararobbsia silviterrae]